jgi:hypothetical protein
MQVFYRRNPLLIIFHNNSPHSPCPGGGNPCRANSACTPTKREFGSDGSSKKKREKEGIPARTNRIWSLKAGFSAEGDRSFCGQDFVTIPAGLQMDRFPFFFFSFQGQPATKSSSPSGLGKVSPGKEIGF